MARRKHFWGRSPLPNSGGPKVWRMVLFLFVLGMIYSQSRQAANWAWLARNAQAQQEQAAAADSPSPTAPAAGDPAASDKPGTTPPPAWETIKEGPTDKDEWEKKAIKDSLAVVTDKTSIQESEMPAYWNLMRWTRAQSFRQLEERAAKKVTMNDLWSTPADYRGKLVRIPLHIRRVSKFEAKGENSAGVKTGYELWGWADHSLSLPFAVIVPELPPGLEVGEEIVQDGVFSGYFFKWMSYQPGVGKARSAPLLIGRILSQPKQVMKAPSLSDDPMLVWFGSAAGIAVLGILLWAGLSSRRIRPIVTAPRDEEATMSFLSGALGPDSTSRPVRESEFVAAKED
jgi:hypothetical protein